MFADHQSAIGQWARLSPQNMRDVFAFTFLTVQQPIKVVPELLADVRKLGQGSVYLWGWKAAAYGRVADQAAAIYEDLLELDAIACPDRCADEMLEYLARHVGLGLAKSGFVAQLAFGRIGCIDSHNIDRFDLMEGRRSPPPWVRADTYKAGTAKLKARYRATYLDFTYRQGGAAVLWDGWCEHVARKFPGMYDGPEHVSRLHCEALIG